ncbi:hypothetical protein SAMN05660242_1261 [Thermoanaerobacterium sp. RBIITD]|nr:hypothetical protein SAMN05660242_1261 [Thermoanaerobacterium sp. RBIITD]
MTFFTISTLNLAFAADLYKQDDKTNIIQNQSVNMNMNFNDVIKKYNLKEVTISEIPKNIKPLEIKDAAELDKILNRFSTSTNLNNVKQSKLNIDSISGNKQSMNLGSAVYSTYIFSPYAWFNIRVKYGYKYSSSLRKNIYTQVYGVSSDLTGFTMWIEWIPDSNLSYGSIVNSGLGLKAHVEGTVNYYLLVNGVVKLYSRHEVHEYTFTNP